MIYFFTDPYRDELIYSTIARYHYYSSNRNFKDTIEECFGKRSAISTFEFAGNLEYLVRELGGKYTSDYIINKHTIFPFYSPFIKENRKKEIVNEIKYKGANTICTKIGMVAGGICKKKDIYYCPICAKKELNSLGEAFIHREHQLQGALICPHDGCVLEKYPTRKLDVSRIEYIRLDINTLELNKGSFECEFYDKLFKLAKDGYYLLANDLSFSSLEEVEKGYKRLLFKKGMMTSNGTIKQSKLYKAFVDYFGEEFLRLLESDIEFENEYNWLKVMTRVNKRASHPLRHLLFIEFIAQNAEEFFQELKANKNVVVANNTALITYRVEDANINIINRYRENIIGYLRKNSKVNRTELRRRFQKEYTYLYRYDKEWLFNNLPGKVKKIKKIVGKVNWEVRDTEYVEAIKKRYGELIDASKPIRITKGTLAKTLGILPNVEKNIDKLPKTKVLLEELCESVKEFQLRRCKVIIDKYTNDNEEIKLWQVQRIAAVKSIYFKEIKKELENYINEKNKEVQDGKDKIKT